MAVKVVGNINKPSKAVCHNCGSMLEFYPVDTYDTGQLEEGRRCVYVTCPTCTKSVRIEPVRTNPNCEDRVYV
jgi:RNase P subunit RPR2